MLQILSNYLFIFILPFMAGAAARLIICKIRRGFILTAGLVVLCIIMWILAWTIPNHGSEAAGLRAVMGTCALAGAGLIELVKMVSRIKNRG